MKELPRTSSLPLEMESSVPNILEPGVIEKLVQEKRAPILVKGTANIGNEEGIFFAIPEEPLGKKDVLKLDEQAGVRVYEKAFFGMFEREKSQCITVFVPNENIEECLERVEKAKNHLSG